MSTDDGPRNPQPGLGPPPDHSLEVGFGPGPNVVNLKKQKLSKESNREHSRASFGEELASVEGEVIVGERRYLMESQLHQQCDDVLGEEPNPMKLNTEDTYSMDFQLSSLPNQFDSEPRILATVDVSDITLVACFPVRGCLDPSQVNQGTTRDETHSKRGGVSVVKSGVSARNCISPHKLSWNEDSPVKTSLDRVSIRTPDWRTEFGESGKPNDSDEELTPAQEPCQWLNSKTMLCGKAVGISVKDKNKGWENLLDFAKCREASNAAARVKAR